MDAYTSLLVSNVMKLNREDYQLRGPVLVDCEVTGKGNKNYINVRAAIPLYSTKLGGGYFTMNFFGQVGANLDDKYNAMGGLGFSYLYKDLGFSVNVIGGKERDINPLSSTGEIESQGNVRAQISFTYRK